MSSPSPVSSSASVFSVRTQPAPDHHRCFLLARKDDGRGRNALVHPQRLSLDTPRLLHPAPPRPPPRGRQLAPAAISGAPSSTAARTTADTAARPPESGAASGYHRPAIHLNKKIQSRMIPFSTNRLSSLLLAYGRPRLASPCAVARCLVPNPFPCDSSSSASASTPILWRIFSILPPTYGWALPPNTCRQPSTIVSPGFASKYMPPAELPRSP
jgi:hypothetical protein